MDQTGTSQVNSVALRQRIRWHIYPDALELAARAAEAIQRLAADSIAQRNAFRIVLCGGSTPLGLYREIRLRQALSPAWQLYLGDERCLPRGDSERNDQKIERALLAGGKECFPRFFRIPSEKGPELAASAYSRVLSALDDFDLVLLGLGEDGHTASLFSGHDLGAGTGAPPALPVREAPKPPPERVTLSADRLSRATSVFFLVTGAAKRRAVEVWASGDRIPASFIRPAGGVDVFLDRGAAPIGLAG